MKSFIALLLISVFITPLPAKDPDPAAVQTASSSPKTGLYSTKEINTVKNYRDFLSYVKNIQGNTKLSTNSITIDQNKVVFANKKEKNLKKDKDNTPSESVHLSPNSGGVAFFDRHNRDVYFFDSNGIQLSRMRLSQYPNGAIAFSGPNVFVVHNCFEDSGGFEIYSSTGYVERWIDAGCITGYAFSTESNSFAVTTSISDASYFILYDAHGNELWKENISYGPKSQISFSPDNAFILIKLPYYWEFAKNSNGKDNLLRKKLYIMDIGRRIVVSEENYND